MDITHKLVDDFLKGIRGMDMSSLVEGLVFSVESDIRNQSIGFLIRGEQVRSCTYDDFIFLCEEILRRKSFSLSALNLDITDLELTTAHDFLDHRHIVPDGYDMSISAPKAKRGYSFEADSGIEIEEADDIAVPTRRSSPAPELAKEDPLSAPIVSEVERVAVSSMVGTYEVVVNFISNRKKSTDERELYEGDRDDIVHYGKSIISIPEEHRSGNVEKPSIWKLQFSENAHKHFSLKSIDEEHEADFFEDIRRQSLQVKRAMVFVHGFNVSFRDALYKAAQLKFDLGFGGPMILFSWPSKGSVLRYTHDITNAEYSSGILSRAIEKIAQLGIGEIFLIGHSMGTRCLTMALKDLARRGSLPHALESLVLAAPDIDKKHFEENIVEAILPLVRSGVIYASNTDKALLASKVINGYSRLGDVDEHIPVFEVIDTVDASGHGAGLGHSYITEDNRVIDDLYHFLFNKTPPRLRRLKDYRNPGDKIYWRFA